MKTYIRIAGTLIALVAVVALAHTTFAADPGEKGGPLTGLERIGKVIDLSNSQKAQISTIITGAQGEVNAIEGNATLSDDAKQTQIHEVARTAHGAVYALLTVDQRAELKRAMAARLHHALDLTPDQRDQIKALKADRASKSAALRADTTLTPDQRRAQVRQLHEDFKAQLAQILTPEQQQKLADYQARRHGERAGMAPTK